MKLIKRIWGDFRKGENIDLYITVTAAIGLAILNLIGLASQSLVFSVILAVLGLVAISSLGSRYKLEQVLDKMSQAQFGVPRSVIVYENWNTPKVGEVLRSANESITVIDSFVGDVGTLASHVKAAGQHSNKPLKVDIYMLDPDRPFGEQRYIEVYGTSDEGNQSSNGFRAKFEDVLKVLRLNISTLPNVKLTIYKYTTMPEVRLYAVDDRDFIFGWFQLQAPASQNPCFHLSTGFPAKEALLAIDKLRNQLKGIQKASQIVTDFAKHSHARNT